MGMREIHCGPSCHIPLSTSRRSCYAQADHCPNIVWTNVQILLPIKVPKFISYILLILEIRATKHFKSEEIMGLNTENIKKDDETVVTETAADAN